MTTYTNNFGFSLQALNENSGSWGLAGAGSYPSNPGPGLNNGVFVPLDAILGAKLTVALSNGNNSISLTQWLNKIFILTGALTGNATVILPLSANSVGSATAVGGEFIVVNNTTGAFTVTVLTAATGSTGVTVPQSQVASGNNFATVLYSDGINVKKANRGSAGFASAVNGNPNGQLAGAAGSVNTDAQLAFDYTNQNLYVCTVTGVASGAGQAVWANPVSSGQTLPEPQGYLTLVSNTPIITSNALSQTILYYTPFYGAWTAINSGSSIVPYKFSSQLPLILSSSQSANQIYDVFLIYSGGTPGTGIPVIASGVAWPIVSPGSGNRGVGAGTAQIVRDVPSGLNINAQAQNMIYNNGSISGSAAVPAGGGVYLGSIWMDAVNGQISCYRSFSQSAKFGVWNPYNRTPIKMVGGDPTAAWNYTVASWRASNNNTANQISTFTGLQEEQITCNFSQNITINTNAKIGIGINSTSAPSGFVPFPQNLSNIAFALPINATYISPPLLQGINNINMLEFGGIGATFNGTQTNMQLSVEYRG